MSSGLHEGKKVLRGAGIRSRTVGIAAPKGGLLPELMKQLGDL